MSNVLGIDLPTNEQTTASDTRVPVLARRSDANETWVLAVNPGDTSVPVTFTLHHATAASLVEVGLPGAPTSSIPVTSSQFSDTLEPLAARAYRVVE